MWTSKKYSDTPKHACFVSEKQSNYSFPYSERHLQCVWYDGAFRPEELMTSEGEKVQIQHPGRWNLEAGPDFLGAILSIGQSERVIKGDVEIHIHPNDWTHHNHTGDARYSAVIAHVTYFPGTLSNHKSTMFSISLKDALAKFSFDSIDVTAYPFHSITETDPPCAIALNRRTPEYFDQLLSTAGHARIKHKRERIKQAMDDKGCEQVFYEEIMCTLGYKNNRIPFKNLAQQVPIELLRSESDNNDTAAYALFLGIAGLLPELKTQASETTRLFVRTLWDHWWRMKEKWGKRTMPRGSWCFAGLRPHNHPARRLAAAAALFTDNTSLLQQLTNLNSLDSDNSYKQIHNIIEENAIMPFWKNRLSFYGKIQKQNISLIGPQRIAAMISNSIIPCIAAKSNIPVYYLIRHLPPEQDNSTIRQAANVLLGPDHNPAIYREGIKQQGLIQIFHDFCLNNKEGCNNCELAKALENDE